MISSLRGKLISKTTTSIVIECNGVGYEVIAPLSVIEKLPTLDKDIFIYIDFVVRDDSQTLFGFLDKETRELFRKLIKVSGVGAKTAIALMSALSTNELLLAIFGGDAERICRAPGIGKKTAERIIIDFRGSPLLDNIGSEHTPEPNIGDRDIEQGLASLGYKKAEIARAIAALPADIGNDPAARLRAALQSLSGR